MQDLVRIPLPGYSTPESHPDAIGQVGAPQPHAMATRGRAKRTRVTFSAGMSPGLGLTWGSAKKARRGVILQAGSVSRDISFSCMLAWRGRADRRVTNFVMMPVASVRRVCSAAPP